MAHEAENEPGSSLAYCETEMRLVKSKYVWEIRNCSFYCDCVHFRGLQSEVAHCGPDKEYNWWLSLISWKELEFLPSRNISFAKLEFSFLDINGKNLSSSLSLEYKRERNLSEDSDPYMMVPLKIGSNFEQDFLKIICQCTISHKRVSTFLEGGRVEYSKTPKSFAKSLADMCENNLFSDFALKVQGRKIPVHKLVLAASSPVFKSMFEHDFKEKQEGLVEIVDFDADTVVSFLSYAYTHEFPKFASLHSAIEVFKMADKYGVDDLKELCKSYLISILDRKTVRGTLELADTYCDNELQEKVKAFIREHPEMLVESPTFQDVLWNKVTSVKPIFRRVLNYSSSLFAYNSK